MAAARLAWTRTWLRKPPAVIRAEEVEEKLERVLSEWDLLAIGVGGTVGSGIFVLCGFIANEYAGPAVVLSWAIAGVGCVFSGLSYCEMSARIPSAGSSYAYAYSSLGELCAFVAGWCLALEYGISGAAVARSWGDKVVDWIQTLGSEVPYWMYHGDVNVPAGFMMGACVIVLLAGMRMGQATINLFTTLKVLLVIFMTVAGYTAWHSDNLSPFIPEERDGNYGYDGVMRGATSAFFGYVGYDEVCCMAGEARNPSRAVPRAVMGTIVGVTVIYILASLALVAMQPYQDIDGAAGFASAFNFNDMPWAEDITRAGEIATLPVVVLISFLAQPRLQFAMAEDGLLPKFFSDQDAQGNLFKGTLLSGVILTVVATVCPFSLLNDIISGGVLIAFNFTNSSVILTRTRRASPNLAPRLLGAYVLLSGVAAFMWQNGVHAAGSGVATAAAAAVLAKLFVACPDGEPVGSTEPPFRVPFFPFTPAIGIAFNWYLVADLPWDGIAGICGYVGAAALGYFLYGYTHSVGNRNGWKDLLGRADEAGRGGHVQSADVAPGADPGLKARLLSPGSTDGGGAAEAVEAALLEGGKTV